MVAKKLNKNTESSNKQVSETVVNDVSKKSKQVKKKINDVQAVEVPVVQVQPVEVPKKRTGGKKQAPVVAAPVAPVEAPKKQGKGKKAVDAVAPAPVEEKKAKAPKVAKAPKAGKAEKVAKKAQKEPKKDLKSEDEDVEGSDDKKQRSFKVRLPGMEDFTGRFTGLTPYQAGNKALSKYYRNADVSDAINIEIMESTRNSKKGVYVYEGSRVKLDTPVEYPIKEYIKDAEGNFVVDAQGEKTFNVLKIITKNFKNKLVKKKRGAVEASA